jgi:hypothetical protein
MPRRHRTHPYVCVLFTLCALALAAGPPAAWAQNGVPSGGAPAATPKVPIGTGNGWTSTTAVPPAFFWTGTGVVFANDSFEFSGKSCLSVTDDFDIGDQFRVYLNGAPIGETSAPGAGAGVEIGPDAAYADPDYSSGTFIIPVGTHSITIEVIANPFAGGRGYIRVDPRGTSPYCPGAPTLPGSGPAALLAVLLLVGILALHRRTARSPATG